MKKTIKHWIFIVSAHITILCVTVLPFDYKQISNKEVQKAILVPPIITNIQYKVQEKQIVSTMESMKYDLLCEVPETLEPEFTDYEVALIERVTMSESSTQPYECQMAVAQTIINRLNSGRYGDSIESIVYEPKQYSTANNGNPSEQVKQAVQEVIDTYPYPDTMVYFREDYYHEFASDYNKFGKLYFSLYE